MVLNAPVLLDLATNFPSLGLKPDITSLLFQTPKCLGEYCDASLPHIVYSLRDQGKDNFCKIISVCKVFSPYSNGYKDKKYSTG